MDRKIQTPYHMIDTDKLKLNMARICKLRENTGCKVLLAVKGFSNDRLLPYFSDLDGISASSLFEARLGREVMNKEVHTFSTAFRLHEFEEIAKYSNTIVFNTFDQYDKLFEIAKAYNCECGIRMKINALGHNKHNLDYCRFGIDLKDVFNTTTNDREIDGLHVHTANNDNADYLVNLLEVIDGALGNFLFRVKWLNLGGGHMFASADYDIDLAISAIKRFRKKYSTQLLFEPCSGIVTGIGSLHTTVLDIINSYTVVLDASPICHMPLSLTVPYEYDIEGGTNAASNGYTYKLVGTTGYPGDIWGEYTFRKPLEIGSSVVIKDTAQYSMVTNNLFNGTPLPALATYSVNDGLQIIKSYDYSDYRRMI